MWKRTYEVGLQIIRYFLVVTFVAVVVATLSECQPFSHYWQVKSDPGPKCRQGAAQLITMGTSDIITDLLLVCFPIPIVLKSNMPIKRYGQVLMKVPAALMYFRKISLVLLFALSLILVGITLYRVVGVIDRNYEQQFRSLLASLEILAAAAVSNALVLGSFVRDRGMKKQRFRHGGSMGGHSSLEQRANTPRRAITQRNWGSDADLVGDLGISCAPELSEKSSSVVPRPAPIALPSSNHAKNLTPAPNEHPGSNAVIREEVQRPDPPSGQHLRAAEMPTTPRGPSFFDVGGLLGENNRPATTKPDSTALPQYRNFSRPTSPLQSTSIAVPQSSVSGRGSDAFLEDVGGLTSPNNAPSQHRPASNERGISLADVLRETGPNVPQRQFHTSEQRSESPPEIQDAGGLLSPLQRPPTSENPGVSLVDVLRETGPNAPPQVQSSSPVQRKDSPPEIQDIGGLLSPELNSRKGPSNSEGTGVNLASVSRETGRSTSSRQRKVPRRSRAEPVGLQDVGGLLS